LLTMSENWQLRRSCQVRVLEETCVATLGGVTVCFDTRSRIRWLRRELSVPPDADPEWVRQEHRPAVRSGNRLLVVQPGVRAISCLNVETGRPYWHHVSPTVTSVIGVWHNTVLVRGTDSIQGFDLESGDAIWIRDVDPEAIVSLDRTGNHLVEFRDAARADDAPPGAAIEFEGIDPATGETLQRGSFAEPRAERLRIGPIIMDKSLWIFWGEEGDPVRNLTQFSKAVAEVEN